MRASLCVWGGNGGSRPVYIPPWAEVVHSDLAGLHVYIILDTQPPSGVQRVPDRQAEKVPHRYDPGLPKTCVARVSPAVSGSGLREDELL